MTLSISAISRPIALVALAGSLLTFSAGCESSAGSGSLLGAGLGALAGQAIGRDSKGTLIGTAIGGIVGYGVGNEMDKERSRNGSRPVADEGGRYESPANAPVRYEQPNQTVEYRYYYYERTPRYYHHHHRCHPGHCHW